MKKNIIIIPIEVKVREFLPKLLLSCMIVKKTNFNVFFGGQRFLTKKYTPKNCIFFDKFTYAENRKDAPFHLKNKVIMQDEEGPISYSNIGSVKKRYSLDQKKYLDFFLFAGKKDLKMIQHLNIDNSKKKIFGLPKLDLLKEKNILFFKDEIDTIKKKYKDYLFVVGHTSSYRSLNQSKFIFKGQGSKKIISNYNNVRENYYELVQLVKKIAIENPKLTIIFRRHPNETKENLEKIFGKKPKNIKLIYRFSVSPWIIACKYFLHSGCQTSLEAIALKKKIITYMPIKVLTNNFNKTKPIFNEEKECLKFFNKKKNQERFFKIKKDIYQIALNIDKKKTYERSFINFLNQSYKKSLKSNLEKRSTIKKNFFKRIIFSLLSTIKSELVKKDIYFKFIPKKYYISKEVKEKKFKSIKRNELKKFIDKFNEIYDTKIRFKNLSESTFLIFK